MKLKIEIAPDQPEEILLRAPAVNDRVRQVQAAVEQALSLPGEIALKKGETEVYLSYGDLLFFETSGERLWAHTAGDCYLCPMRLRDLAEVLPRTFVRASKSCLVNTGRIRSITRSPTGVSEAAFVGTDKTAYISRMYYKVVREVIAETRLTK